jgi:hypothetical protein
MFGCVLFTGSVLLTRKLSQLKYEPWSPSSSESIIRTTNQIENQSLILQNQLPENWKQFRSQKNGTKRCKIKLVNNMSQSTLIFCWIGFDGTLHHFRSVNDRSIRDGSVPNWIVEVSTVFHAFVCFKPGTGNENVTKLDQLDPQVSDDFI